MIGSIKSKVFLLVSLFTLTACQSTSTSTSTKESRSFSLPSSISSFAPQKDPGGFLFPDITTTSQDKVFNFARMPGQSAMEGSSPETFALRNRVAESYMQEVGKRLLRHWTGEEPKRVGIFLSPQDGLNGAATPFGDVFISLRTVNKTKSEDELAAIIAHEMAHVLLNHHQDSKFVRNASDAGLLAARSYAHIAVISRMDSQKIGKGRYRFYLPESQKAEATGEALKGAKLFLFGVTMLKDVGLAHYDRRQEHEADAFAVEMLHKAGYDPTAMASVIEYIRTNEEEASKRRRQYNAQKLKLKSFDFGSISDAVVTGIGGAVTEIAQKVTHTHPEAHRRLDRVSKQASALLGDGIPPQRKTKRHKAMKSSGSFRSLANFYEKLHLYISQPDDLKGLEKLAKMLRSGFGRTALARTMAYMTMRTYDAESAYNLLKTATETNYAPADYYYSLALAHARHGKGKEAKLVVAKMQSRFPRASTYPTAVSAALILEDEAWKQASMDACLAQDNKDIRQHCKDAAKGIKADERYRAGHGLIGALAQGDTTPKSKKLAPFQINKSAFDSIFQF